MDAINDILLDPRYHDILAILRGTRNGFWYGAKLRFSHALVMSVLFRSGSLKSRWASIIKATRQHATALGSFVFIYKTTLYLLKHLPSIFSNTRRVNTTSKHDIQTHARGVDAFIAGLVAGYIVFGRATPTAGLNSINQQMVLYVFSRVVLAIAKLALDQVLAYSMPSAPKSASSLAAPRDKFLVGSPIDPNIAKRRNSLQAIFISNTAWTVFASLSWGIVMYLFRTDSSLLQHSMLHSMRYLYVDSESWSSLLDFI